MDLNTTQLWGGALLVALGAAVLLGSVVLRSADLAVLVVGTLLLAAGAVLVGWSQRGRPV